MKIVSGKIGEIEIDPAKIITFADGVIGFPDFKRYVELEFLENSPLKLLQAVDSSDLGFIMINPLIFEPDYVADITIDELKSLNTDKSEELVTMVFVTIPEDPYEMTANLQGPVIINLNSRLAVQIVNHNQKYSTKHRILKADRQASNAQ